jgi:hypothetical protein
VDYKRIVEQAGGTFVGVRRGCARTGDLIQFRPTKDGPILSVYARLLSAEDVRLAIKNFHDTARGEAWQAGV